MVLFLVQYYGIKEEKEYDVDFDVEILSSSEPSQKYEYDDTISIGNSKIKQSGSKAMVVNVYKVVKFDGSIISRTLLSHDTYSSLEKIIVKNPLDN